MRTFLMWVYSLYGYFMLILFLIAACLIAATMHLLNRKKSSRNIGKFLYGMWIPLFIKILGIRLEVVNRSELPIPTSSIIVSNHQSQYDILVNAAAYPGVYRYLSKWEVSRYPMVGWLASKVAVFVKRKESGSRNVAVRAITKRLDQQDSILIYPEGGRTRDGQLRKFRNGAFRLATMTNSPIMCMTIIGSGKLSPPDYPFRLRPGRITCVIDGPFQDNNSEVLKSTIRERMAKNLSEFSSD